MPPGWVPRTPIWVKDGKRLTLTVSDLPPSVARPNKRKFDGANGFDSGELENEQDTAYQKLKKPKYQPKPTPLGSGGGIQGVTWRQCDKKCRQLPPNMAAVNKCGGTFTVPEFYEANSSWKDEERTADGGLDEYTDLGGADLSTIFSSGSEQLNNETKHPRADDDVADLMATPKKRRRTSEMKGIEGAGWFRAYVEDDNEVESRLRETLKSLQKLRRKAKSTVIVDENNADVEMDPPADDRAGSPPPEKSAEGKGKGKVRANVERKNKRKKAKETNDEPAKAEKGQGDPQPRRKRAKPDGSTDAGPSAPLTRTRVKRKGATSTQDAAGVPKPKPRDRKKKEDAGKDMAESVTESSRLESQSRSVMATSVASGPNQGMCKGNK
ncbi:hypothetical protein DFH07DRAFT_774432 [Mycena maculata]|uniref:Uncharacterized protein n=1 Tax=Mycena maculata TaxID=230809 RepID=A0AAD7NAF5_9AGAR|nr:hypothetical protein DFH07DRAFT_774432 [Mycena maculata]